MGKLVLAELCSYGRSGLDGDVDWDRFSPDTLSTIDLSCASLRVKVSWLALSSRCKIA